MDIELSPGTLNDKEISQVQVELSYTDAANDFKSQRTFVLTPAQPGAHWKLRLSDPSLRTYEYRLTYFLKDGLRYQTDWLTSESPSLVVNDPFQDVLKLRLVPLLDAAALVEADVNVTYQEAETGYERHIQTVFAGPALATQPITIPTLAKDPAGFTYDVTVIRQDGSVFESGPMTADADTRALVISDGAGTTHRIKAKLLNADLTGANLAALTLKLQGHGENPDFAEALFTASQVGDQLLTLVEPDGEDAFSYKFSVTGYSREGLPIQGDSGETSDANFLIRLPTP
jgi:hypothetical protein